MSGESSSPTATALLAYVGIARCASADQVHRLIAPEHSKKLVYHRLAKLCLPRGRLGEGACLRRLHYRRYEGTSEPVCALTPYGHLDDTTFARGWRAPSGTPLRGRRHCECV